MPTPKKKPVRRKRPALPPRPSRAAKPPKKSRRLSSGKSGKFKELSEADLPDFLKATSTRVARTPETDCFRPPRKNCRVFCLHCHEKYDSYRIEWREFANKDGSKDGFWCCPIDGCDGKGFMFDIHPTDPNWEDEEDRGMSGGWFDDDGKPCPPDFADDIPF